jgi:3-oxoacyl-[acyl-carrier-protein] synthase II
VLGRFGALAKPDVDGRERARPFDRRANGWIAAEGSAVALVEKPEDAAARGAAVLATIRAAGSAFDPNAPRNGWSVDPAPLAASLKEFLARHEAGPASVGRVVCGACGHRAADALEAAILREVWGHRELPPVIAPAATAGRHGGALLLGSVLAAGGSPFGATPGFESPIPALDVRPHDGRPLPDSGLTLMISTAAGGSAGWALLEGANV